MFYYLYRISRMVFHEKIFLLLHSISYPNFIVWLHLLLEISDKMFIVIICYSVGVFINFEIYLSFLINTKRISTWSKNQNENLQFLKSENSF